MAEPCPFIGDCDDSWHFGPGRLVLDERRRREHDARRESSTCPTCKAKGSGWVCVDCGLEIPYDEVAFRPRCKQCHILRDGMLTVVRAQERIERACFDEEPDRQAAMRHHRRILSELGA